MTIVLDASATVEYLIGSRRAGPVGDALRAPRSTAHLPALCDVEVASAFRRLLLNGVLTEERTEEALRDYVDLPVTRHGHQHLLGRILSLRDNFSAYDATYVALAARLGADLVTGDENLARAAKNHLHLSLVLI